METNNEPLILYFLFFFYVKNESKWAIDTQFRDQPVEWQDSLPLIRSRSKAHCVNMHTCVFGGGDANQDLYPGVPPAVTRKGTA